MENKPPELFNLLDDFNREVAAGSEVPPEDNQEVNRLSALKLLLERLPAKERDQLTRLVREAHWTDNDPILIFRTFGQFRDDANVAKVNAVILHLLQVVEEIRGTEAGLGKYLAQQQALTEETKEAIVEAETHLKTIQALNREGRKLTPAGSTTNLFKVACLASAMTVGAELVLRLLLPFFH